MSQSSVVSSYIDVFSSVLSNERQGHSIFKHGFAFPSDRARVMLTSEHSYAPQYMLDKPSPASHHLSARPPAAETTHFAAITWRVSNTDISFIYRLIIRSIQVQNQSASLSAEPPTCRHLSAPSFFGKFGTGVAWPWASNSIVASSHCHARMDEDCSIEEAEQQPNDSMQSGLHS